MKHWLLVPLALVAAWPLAAAERKTITHEDLWQMPRVGAPQLSPDGRLAVFSVSEPSYKKDESVSDLWLVPTDGSAPARRLTGDKAGESGAAWSRDGRRIAFAAKRGDDKQAQLHVLDLAQGGEALRVTKLSTGASSPVFSPDGTRLLFSSHVYPDSKTDADNERLAKEEEDRKYKARVYTGFPIRHWDKWLDGKQARLFVQTIGSGEARDLLAGSELVKLAGYSLPDGGAVWAPDGKSVVFSASRNRDRAAWSFTNSDLFVVPVDGGEPRRLTGRDVLDAGDSFGNPRFSRDGKTLFATIQPYTGKVYNASRIAVFDWPSMRERGRIELPEGRDIGSFGVSPDGRRVFITAEDAGQEKLYEATVGAGMARLVGSPKQGTWAALAVGGTREPVLVASYESATEPAEIVRLDVRGGAHTRLTAFAVARAATLDLAPVEHFRVDNARGQSIHSMLVKPPKFDPAKKYPLLVLMHGGPHTQWRDQFVLRWNYHLLGAQGYVLLLTNYVGSTGFGEAFAQAIQGDPLKGPASDINLAADEAIKRYAFIDASRQCAGGASYGGHLANWMQATTTRYRCLISHAGLVNLETQWGTSDSIYGREVSAGGPVWEQAAVWREQNPIRLAANFRTPVLVTFGEKDYRVPLNNGLEYWSALQRQKVESRFIVFPEENHWVLNGENSRFFYREVGDWLARWLDDVKPVAAKGD
ncbi:MAG TPA: S9 family peptidase [Dokdonella sp.]|uniref:S9 family peptidase n=1 Tax=Dokdonella sp. TaxID=2291710 RepID=UPI0025BAB48A|nr:S9 family peptidase [Dokdonella sp.]MBX3690605.1 S9 family peptidase [Dokdonella sp.]HNR92664.1 S9 family peptidase [Dokdonella sp.]